MKKAKVLLITVLIAMLVASLCSCARKSDAAKAADELIAAIGTVGSDSEPAIIAAENAVSELTEEEVKTLDGLEALTAARNAYNALVDAGIIAEVEEKIAAIGTVSIESENAIHAAQEAYDALEDRLKSGVSNISVLEDAKDAFITAQAAEIEALINAIGSVNAASEDAISTARSAYEKASSEVQGRVSNIADLTAAEDAYLGLRAAEIENAINAIGNVTLDSGSLIDAARGLYNKASDAIKEKVSNYSVLTEAEETFAELEEAERIRQMTLNTGDTVTTVDWSVTLKKAYTSTTLESSQSTTSWIANEGYAFLILEFDITCLNSSHPTIDDDGITDLVATLNGNTYSSWEYQYISSKLWLYIRHTYLDANLPLHIYVYTYVPKANMHDTITINLKIDGQDKLIVINK